MSAPDAVGDTRFMPTASEFRTIAATLDACRDEVVGLATALHSLPTDGALTGPVRTAINATVGVTLTNLRAVDADLAERAAEARHRAAICDAYSDAYRRFLRSDDTDRVPPRRPAAWVRYG